jgi:hypothetical protein
MSTITLDSLGRLSAAELRAAIAELDDQLTAIHLDQDGSIRENLTRTEAKEFEATMALRGRAEAHLIAREQFERHPGSAVLPFGQRLTSTTGPAVIPSDTRSAYGATDARQELRNRALQANDRCDTMPDAARAHMAAALQSDPDPESKLARYTIAPSPSGSPTPSPATANGTPASSPRTSACSQSPGRWPSVRSEREGH